MHPAIKEEVQRHIREFKKNRIKVLFLRRRFFLKQAGMIWLTRVGCIRIPGNSSPASKDIPGDGRKGYAVEAADEGIDRG